MSCIRHLWKVPSEDRDLAASSCVAEEMLVSSTNVYIHVDIHIVLRMYSTTLYLHN